MIHRGDAEDDERKDKWMPAARDASQRDASASSASPR